MGSSHKGSERMTHVNIPIDYSLKEKADSLFEELGLSMTTAVNIFVRQAVKQGGIPFEITAKTDPFYSDSNMRVLMQSIKEADEGKLTEHELIEV
jgi:DNA-damage-inducible protein J